MQNLFGRTCADICAPVNSWTTGAAVVWRRRGYSGSTYLPGEAAWQPTDLVQINTHIDPIYWRGTRGLRSARDADRDDYANCARTCRSGR